MAVIKACYWFLQGRRGILEDLNVKPHFLKTKEKTQTKYYDVSNLVRRAHSFTTAAVTIYQKLSAANHCLSSGGQKSKLGLPGLKSRCRPGSLPSGGSRGEFASRLFQFPGQPAPLGSWTPSALQALMSSLGPLLPSSHLLRL